MIVVFLSFLISLIQSVFEHSKDIMWFCCTSASFSSKSQTSDSLKIEMPTLVMDKNGNLSPRLVESQALYRVAAISSGICCLAAAGGSY